MKQKLWQLYFKAFMLKKEKRQVHLSCEITYLREGDLVWDASVVIQPRFAGKPSSVITSTFYTHGASTESEWPWRAVV